MRIQCTTTFLHGRDRFEAGDVRNVSDEDARYFIGQQWAVPAAGDAQATAAAPAAPAVTTLDIHNTVHAQEARHG